MTTNTQVGTIRAVADAGRSRRETHPVGPRAVHLRTCDRVHPFAALHARLV